MEEHSPLVPRLVSRASRGQPLKYAARVHVCVASNASIRMYMQQGYRARGRSKLPFRHLNAIAREDVQRSRAGPSQLLAVGWFLSLVG